MMKSKNFIIINLFWLLLVLFLFLSCAPQKRINRIVKKHPHLLQKDTVIIKDTVKIFIPGVELEGNVSVEDNTDQSAFFKEGILEIETIIINDTLYVKGKCDTVFVDVIREIEVPVDRIIVHKPRDKLSWWEKITFVISVLGCCFAIGFGIWLVTIIKQNRK